MNPMRRTFPNAVRSITYMEIMTLYIVVGWALSALALTADCGPEREAARQEPANAERSNALGWCLYRGGKFHDAAEAFRAHPESVEAAVGMAYAALQVGRVQEARGRFREI